MTGWRTKAKAIVAATVLGGVLVAACAARAEIVATSARSEPGEREAKLVFALSACVDFQAYVLDLPARAIVDLPEINFQIDAQQGRPTPAAPRRKSRAASKTTAPPPAEAPGLSYRFGRLSPGKSRIVVDLAHPVALSVACAVKAGGGELTLSLKAVDEAGFRAAARAGAERQAQNQPPAPPLAPANPADAAAKPVIVLDPGHGGVDSGTLGRGGVVEKQVVLEFAKALGEKLRASGRYRVEFTREDDSFIPLQERSRLAQRLGAALFVSLHADALPGRDDSVAGATVYTVSERASDREAARIAEHENKADSAAGQEATDPNGEVSDILADLTRRETRAYSSVFAKYLSERWKIAARLNKNPRRSAGFVVLKAPDVPSALLELGYLSNAQDAADLTSPQWRDKAATQAVEAIDDFFAAKRPAAQSPRH